MGGGRVPRKSAYFLGNKRSAIDGGVTPLADKIQYLKGSLRARSSKNCSPVGGRFIKGKNKSFVLRECPVRPRSIKGKHVAGCICSASCTSANILHMYTLTLVPQTAMSILTQQQTARICITRGVGMYWQFLSSLFNSRFA